ncbi:MAG: flagellar hook-length control protein FliK [Mariprofundales bacterium]
MITTQATSSASGVTAESGQSGVFQGQGKKGGLFAILMQAFQNHLKVGANAGGLAQQGATGKGDLLATLLQGKHGAEISALLGKLGKGDGALDAKALAGLSTEALSALKQALTQNPSLFATTSDSGDGAVNLASQIKAALKTLASEDGTSSKPDATMDNAQSSTTKKEDGSSLEAALVASGVQVAASPIHAKTLVKKGDEASSDFESGIDEKAKKAALNTGKQTKAAAGQAAATRQAATGQAATGQAVTGQAVTGQAVTGQAVTGQAVTTGKSGAESVTSEQTSTAQAVTPQASEAAKATDDHPIQVSVTAGASAQANTSKGQPASQDPTEQPSHDLTKAPANPLLKGGEQGVQAKVASNDQAQDDDGIASSAFRQITTPASTPLNGTNDASTRGAQQALASASQGNQGNNQQSGEQSSQQGNKSPQSGVEGLFNDLRSDRANAKGSDFFAQMAYKSTSVWKPAEAMLQIGKAAADGSMKLELQLEPAHLGKIHVSIQSDASKQVQLHITVDNPAGRAALDQNMGQLRQALAQQGLDLGSFSMNLSSQGQQGQQHGNDSSSASAQGTTFRLQTDEAAVETDLPIGTNRAPSGRLSILA